MTPTVMLVTNTDVVGNPNKIPSNAIPMAYLIVVSLILSGQQSPDWFAVLLRITVRTAVDAPHAGRRLQREVKALHQPEAFADPAVPPAAPTLRLVGVAIRGA